LIGHERWLHFAEFVDQFVAIIADDEIDAADAPMAIVDWSGAVAALDTGGLPCSSGEAQVLQIAASMAGAAEVGLSGVLCGLDRANMTLVAEAVMHAGGHPVAATMRPER
jgi:hypothetical protein